MTSYSVGKSILVFGVVLALLGLLVMISGRIPFLGRLPGDIAVKRPNFQFYFPITTCLLLSLVITLLLRLFGRK